MVVKLHRCRNNWVRNDVHPCWRVQRALDEQGIEYRLVMGPVRRSKRTELQRLSGQRAFPVIELEDGTIYRADSKEIAAVIRAGRLFDASARGRRAPAVERFEGAEGRQGIIVMPTGPMPVGAVEDLAASGPPAAPAAEACDRRPEPPSAS